MDVLLVGLGNPGPKYQGNRHNIGFAALDWMLERDGSGSFRKKQNGELAEIGLAGKRVLLLKPQTFMNRSGAAVSPVAKYYKITPERIWVVHDEMDVGFGRLKLKVGGGSGGHNGIKDIDKALGTKEYGRIRVGVGRPRPGADPVAHVLSDFSAAERKGLDDVFADVATAFEIAVTEGIERAQERFHAKRP